jgi:acetate kinase
VNAGSSSLKLRLLGPDDELLESHDLPAGADVRVPDARVDAVGHRVVHGGTRFREPVLVDDLVVRELRSLAELAPLHQPKSLAALEATARVLPDVPAVACFDTAFHSTLPDAAAAYALPRELSERFEIRRYGFHGLSHAYASRRAAELLDRPLAELRIVTCHLGAGASLAAVRAGESVETTMGFTPLEGLPMATRSGSVDPGLLLWLIEREGMAAAELADALEHRSGMLGLAGTADMHEVVEQGGLAFDVYVHRLRAGVAAMAAAMNGLDALVFTGGVGENSSEVRAAALEGLRFLGEFETLVIPAREDLEIARQVRETLA